MRAKLFAIVILFVCGEPSAGKTSLLASEDVCRTGSDLALVGKYEEALQQWKSGLDEDVEYKVWLRRVIDCLRETGIARSEQEIATWYEEAHNGGSVIATVHLAMLIATGIGRTRNVAEALALLETAADRGDQFAEFLIHETKQYCQEKPDDCPGL